MKLFAIKTILFVLAALTLAACGPAAESALVEPTFPTVEAAATTPPPSATSTSIPDQTAQPTAFSFEYETATYRDEAAGFELDYPAGWYLDDGESHSRGYYRQFYSWNWQPGEVVETIPPGETVLALTINDWDPKNDLEAFVQQRKLAWETSGMILLTEERLILSGEWPAARFIVQTPNGVQGFFQFTPVGEQYLTLSGSGNLQTLAEIANTLRLIS